MGVKRNRLMFGLNIGLIVGLIVGAIIGATSTTTANDMVAKRAQIVRYAALEGISMPGWIRGRELLKAQSNQQALCNEMRQEVSSNMLRLSDDPLPALMPNEKRDVFQMVHNVVQDKLDVQTERAGLNRCDLQRESP